MGVRPEAIDLHRLETEYLSGNSWNYHSYSESFRDNTGKILATKPVWYVDEIHAIREGAVSLMRKGPGNLSVQDVQRYDQSLMHQFPSHPSVVLVPAKRGLTTKVSVNNAEAIHPNGSGIVNFLFSSKNSQKGSESSSTFDAISAGFEAITSGWAFDVFFSEANTLQLMFKRPGGNWLSADDCGVGFRDLLIIPYFALASLAEVVLVEEPENHQHPDIQRKLIGYLRDHTSKQFVISTHSNVFSNTLYADRVFNCRIDGDVKVENVTSRAALLASLGYAVADNLVSDLVIFVEGPSDKAVLEEFFRKMELNGKYVIRIWPLGGDIMNQLDLTVFSEAYRLLALIDTDPQSRKVRDSFKEKCSKLHIPVHQLSRYAIENYLSLTVIENVMHQKAPADLKSLAANKKVSEQLGFDVKRNAAEIARNMTMEDLNGTDLLEFLQTAEKMLAG